MTVQHGAGAEHTSTSETDRGHGAVLQGVCGRLSGLVQGQQHGFSVGWTGLTRKAVMAADRSPEWDELGWLKAAVGGGGSNTARAGCIDLHGLRVGLAGFGRWDGLVELRWDGGI
jgi:hypothetical protein